MKKENKKEIENKIDDKKKKIHKTFSQVYKNFLSIFKRPEMRILPGQLAFSFLLSLVPIIAILVFVVSFIIKNFDLLTLLESTLPKVFANLIYTFVQFKPTRNIIIILICYIWLASNGPSGINVAADTLYDIEVPNYFKLKLKGVFMTLILIVLLVFMISIPILGDEIIDFILSLLKNPEPLYKYVGIYKLLKYFVTLIILFLNIKLLYIIAPDKTVKSKHTTLGAVFTTISWFIVTELFGFYITEIARYDLVYGNFANILILLMWIYFLSYFFVIGLAINVNKYKYD